MLTIEPRHLKIVKDILSKYHYQFYAFGSRVKGTARRLSDLDLCYKEDIPLCVVMQLEEDFEESDLPFKVDIVNWQQASQEFRNAIQHDLVLVE